MLAYALDRRSPTRLQPTTLGLILAGHAAALLAVMTASGDLPTPPSFDPTDIFWVRPVTPPPPPPPPVAEARPHEATSARIDQPPRIVPTPTPTDLGPIDVGPPPTAPGNGTSDVVLPALDAAPVPKPPVATAAMPLTGSDDLVPPYPEAKRDRGEEATIRLSLSIDSRGRVVAVAPLGAADPVFVDAARRHILRHWRYRPATEDGRPVTSTVKVAIRFKMEG